jgi:hypothetical protein
MGRPGGLAHESELQVAVGGGASAGGDVLGLPFWRLRSDFRPFAGSAEKLGFVEHVNDREAREAAHPDDATDAVIGWTDRGACGIRWSVLSLEGLQDQSQ